MSRFLRIALAGVLTLAVSTSAFVSCLPGEAKQTDEMACCTKGQHDCGPAMQAADCCKSPVAAFDKFVSTKPGSPVKPIVALSYVPATELAAQGLRVLPGHASQPLGATSPPLFLLTSSLRI